MLAFTHRLMLFWTTGRGSSTACGAGHFGVMTLSRLLNTLPTLLLVGALTLPHAAVQADETEVQLSKGSIVLSNEDGTQISMAPGSDVALGKDSDGAPMITLNTGEVYLSNVLQRRGRPLRLLMGDQVVEINRASVIVSRAGGNMDVTMLHGRRVNFQAGTPSLTQAGTRMRMGDGSAPRIDRPSTSQMAALKGAVGILSGNSGTSGNGIGRPPAQVGKPPKPPQAQVPGQIGQQIAVSPPRRPSGGPPQQPGGGFPNLPPGLQPPGVQPPGNPPPPSGFPNLPPGLQPPGNQPPMPAMPGHPPPMP